MTNRKKKGIGYLISGGVFVALGIIFNVTEVTPDWVSMVLPIVGFVANAFGFSVVFPDTEE